MVSTQIAVGGQQSVGAYIRKSYQKEMVHTSIKSGWPRLGKFIFNIVFDRSDRSAHSAAVNGTGAG